MKKCLLLMLCTLYTGGMFASQPAVPVKLPAGNLPAVQKLGWVTSLARTVAHKGYEYATQAINLVRNDPTNKRIAIGAACAAVGYSAIKLCERFFTAKKETSEDLQTALEDLANSTDCYDEQVRKLKEFLAFSAPAIKVGRAIQDLRVRRYTWSTALIGGLTAGAEILSFMPLVCSYPVDAGAWLLSHVPSPCVFNPLRRSRLQIEAAWRNIRRIIEERNSTVADITKSINTSHARLTPQMIDTIKSYAVEGGKREKEDIWVSSMPQQVHDLLVQIKNPEIFKDVPLPQVVSLQGLSGTGKSLMARYIGRQIGGYFKHYAPGNFYSKWHGEGEGFVRNAYAEALAEARKTGKPSVIFIDEIENIAQKRNFDDQRHGGERANNSLLVEFFNQIDMPEYKNKIILVSASNAPLESFDPAFRRRATYEVQLQLPTQEEAFSLLCHEAAKYPAQMASLLQNNGEFLHEAAQVSVAHRLSRDAICKVITDAVRNTLAMGVRSREQSYEKIRCAYEELIRGNPQDQQLHDEVQTAMQAAQAEISSHPIAVKRPDLVQAFLAIDAKESNLALPVERVQRGPLTPLRSYAGRVRGLSRHGSVRFPLRRGRQAEQLVPVETAMQIPVEYDSGL